MMDVRIKAALDQEWMEMDKYLPDIVRLVKTGLPANERDVQIFYECVTLIAGELFARRDERSNPR